MSSLFQHKRTLLFASFSLLLICSGCHPLQDSRSQETSLPNPIQNSLPSEAVPTSTLLPNHDDPNPTSTNKILPFLNPGTVLPHTPIPTPTNTPTITSEPAFPLQPSVDLQLIGQFGGAIHDLEVKGSYLYMGLGLRVAVIDISDPWNPHFTGLSEILNGVVTDISLSGDLAFVVTQDGSLTALDLSDPSILHIKGTSPTLYRPSAITSNSGYAFVTESECFRERGEPCIYLGGIEVFDVSNPGEMQRIGFIENPGGYTDIVIEGDLAYVTGGQAGLSIFNISRPNDPKVIGMLWDGHVGGELTIAGNYVYTNHSGESATVVDITDPSSPFVKIDSLGIITGEIKISNGHIFNLNVNCDMAFCGSGLDIIETFDGLPTMEDGHVTFKGRLRGGFVSSNPPVMTIDRNMAYTTGPKGVMVIDVRDTTNPVLVGGLMVPDYVSDVAVFSHYAYIPIAQGHVDGLVGFHVLNLAHLSGPYPVVAFHEWEYPDDCLFYKLNITIHNALAYISTFHEGPGTCEALEILDLLEPLTPKRVWAEYRSFAGYEHIVIFNHLAYLISFIQSVEILDVSNPRSPSHVGYISMLENVTALSVAGEYGYVWIEGEGLKIYDWSDIKSPQQVGQLQWESRASSLVVEDDIALVGQGSILAIDVSDPSHPQTISSFEFPVSVRNLVIVDGILYASAGEAGVLMIEFIH